MKKRIIISSLMVMIATLLYYHNYYDVKNNCGVIDENYIKTKKFTYYQSGVGETWIQVYIGTICYKKQRYYIFDEGYDTAFKNLTGIPFINGVPQKESYFPSDSKLIVMTSENKGYMFYEETRFGRFIDYKDDAFYFHRGRYIYSPEDCSPERHFPNCEIDTYWNLREQLETADKYRNKATLNRLGHRYTWIPLRSKSSIEEKCEEPDNWCSGIEVTYYE